MGKAFDSCQMGEGQVFLYLTKIEPSPFVRTPLSSPTTVPLVPGCQEHKIDVVFENYHPKNYLDLPSCTYTTPLNPPKIGKSSGTPFFFRRDAWAGTTSPTCLEASAEPPRSSGQEEPATSELELVQPDQRER